MQTIREPDWNFAVGLGCHRAFQEREGHSDIPLSHVEPVTPDVLRKAADELEAMERGEA